MMTKKVNIKSEKSAHRDEKRYFKVTYLEESNRRTNIIKHRMKSSEWVKSKAPDGMMLKISN